MFQTTQKSDSQKSESNERSKPLGSKLDPSVYFHVPDLTYGAAEVAQLKEEEELQKKEAKTPVAQRMVEEEEEKAVQGKVVQKQEEEDKQMKMTSDSSKEGAGSSGTTARMPEEVQTKMENSFGTSFGGVNIHQNDESATQMGALAYTQGNNVHFAPGQYNPSSQKGQELLGHELTHVVQQREGRVQPTKQGKGMSVNDSPALEHEADVMGKKAAEGKSASVRGTVEHYSVQRQSKQPWSNMLNSKGRSGLITFIPEIIDLINKRKDNAVDVWGKNADIQDFKPGAFALELALSVLGAAIGGALGSIAGNVISKVASEVVKDASVDALKKLYDIGYDKLKGLLTTQSSNLKADASQGLSVHVKSGLKDYYVQSSKEMFESERYAMLNKFTNDQSSMSDEELAILAYTLDSTYKSFRDDAEPILQKITIGYMKLQDVIYISNKSGVKGDLTTSENQKKLKEFYQKDNHIAETDTRPGQMLVVGPMGGGIGKYTSPNIKVSHGIVTDINEATQEHLKNVKIEDLPFSLSFRFWAQNPQYDGSIGDILTLTDSNCKVWFVKDTFGSVWVDADESMEFDSNGYNQGREWLARYYLQSDKKLSKKEIMKYAPEGALKLYQNLKGLKLSKVIDLDMF